MTVDIQLLALLSGFLVGDPVLNSEGQRWKTRLGRTLLVSALSWLFLGSAKAWVIILPAALFHFTLASIVTGGSRRPVKTQVAVKISNILLLVLIWLAAAKWLPYAISNYWVTIWGNSYGQFLILASGFTTGVWGMADVLKHQMIPLTGEFSTETRKGLLSGGRTIGILERTLVLMFVLAGKPEGVAFAVAAKSVFRIGDLTDHDDRLHAEYIMIGTLRSFTYALAVAFLTKWLMAEISIQLP